MSQKPETADQFRARIEAQCAAAATPNGGSFIRLQDGSLVPDPNSVTTGAPVVDVSGTVEQVAAAIAADVIAATETVDPPTQSAAKKGR